MKNACQVVKNEIYLSEEKNVLKRKKDLERIKQEIKNAETSAKRFIGLRKYSVLDEIKKEIFDKISVGEPYNELKHNVRRALVTQDIFEHKDDATKLRKKVQEDLRKDLKMDLLQDDEIKKMRQDLKKELLEELGVCSKIKL